MILIPSAQPFTLVQDVIYATPVRASLYTKFGAGTVEVSNDASTWSAITPDANGSFITAAPFIRSTTADSLIIAKGITGAAGGGGGSVSMKTVPIFEFPIQPQSNIAVAPGLGNLTLNTADDRIACILYPTKIGSIRTIHLFTGGVTTGATVDVRVETVNPATGDPSGTLWAANTNAALVIADTDDNVTKSVTLTADAVITDLSVPLAIVIDNPDVSPGNLVLQTVAYYQGVGLPYHDFFDGATWAKGNATPTTLMVGLQYSDGSFSTIPGIHPGGGTITTTTFNNTSTPDAIGARFRLPLSMRVIGARSWINLTADANLRLVNIAYNQGAGTGILGSTLLDTNLKRAAAPYLFPVMFPTPITLSANTYYRLIIEPTSASNVSVYDMTFSSLQMLDAFCSQDFHLTTAKDPTGDGDWTNFNSGTFRAPYFGLICNGIVG